MTADDAPLGPGLGDSQRALLDLLKRRGASTLAELETELSLTRETLRGHLEALAGQGLVERAGVRRSGPGRPHVLYRLAAASERLFPRREGMLLRELISYLRESGNVELVDDFFAVRMRRLREAFAPRLAGLAGDERLEEVAAILSEQGYVADIERDGERRRLRLCHCPIAELVAVSQEPCRAEVALVRELLGPSLQLRREAFIPAGAHACIYSLEPVDAADPGLVQLPARGAATR